MNRPRLAIRRARLFAGLLAAAAFASAAPAGALSLADLKQDDFSVVSGGVEFSEFRVKVKGLGLNDDLGSHEVVFEDGGFQIELAHGFQNKKAKVRLKYVATAVGGELTNAVLDADAGSGDIKVKTRIKGAGKLLFSSEKPDESMLGLALGDLDMIKVKSAFKVKTSALAPYIDPMVISSYAMSAPEPGTAALCALGLAGLAAARRRRSA